MKVSPVGQYGVKLTCFGLINCFLVREEDGWTLIDTGFGGSAPAILRAASGTPIAHIFLTHAHQDHVGSTDALIAALGPTSLSISSREARLLKRDFSLDPEESGSLRKSFFPGINSTPSRLLNHGELLGSLRCISTPGHTPGHFSFLDERDGTLYAGDALTSYIELRSAGNPFWYLPITRLFSWNAHIANTSVRGLLNYPIQRIACGHGPIIENARSALQGAVRSLGFPI